MARSRTPFSGGSPRLVDNGVMYCVVAVGVGSFKVGFTTGNPIARVRSLRTGSPVPLALHGVRRATFSDERRFHSEMSRGLRRLHGEWYAGDPDECGPWHQAPWPLDGLLGCGFACSSDACSNTTWLAGAPCQAHGGPKNPASLSRTAFLEACYAGK